MANDANTRTVEEKFWKACDTAGIGKKNKRILKSLLAPLKHKSAVTRFHYLHSLRVGMLARKIGKFLHHEERPLLFAGALLDLGKCQTPLDILGKSESWSDEDQRAVEAHVLDGYRMIRGRFDMSAEIILWHHRFQKNPYPRALPPFLHDYPETTKLLIREYGRIIAIADVYDALHRVDAKFGQKQALTRREIMEKMFEFNPDRKKLVAALYTARILMK